MKLGILLVLAISALFLTVGLVSVGYTLYKIDQIVPFEAKLKVSERDVGVVVDTDSFNLGTVPLGGSTKRKLLIENTKDEPREMMVLVEGTIAQFINQPSQTYLLGPKEQKVIEIEAVVPRNAQLGEYIGKISVIVQK